MILGYKKGVHTFVEYWEFGNKRKTIKASTAELIKHKYFDTIEVIKNLDRDFIFKNI